MEFKLKNKNPFAIGQNYFLLSPIGGTVVPNLPKGKLGNNCFCQSQKLLYICFKYYNTYIRSGMCKIEIWERTDKGGYRSTH